MPFFVVFEEHVSMPKLKLPLLLGGGTGVDGGAVHPPVVLQASTGQMASPPPPMPPREIAAVQCQQVCDVWSVSG